MNSTLKATGTQAAPVMLIVANQEAPLNIKAAALWLVVASEWYLMEIPGGMNYNSPSER